MLVCELSVKYPLTDPIPIAGIVEQLIHCNNVARTRASTSD